MPTTLRVILSADPTAEQLEKFKRYASIPDCSQDAVLQKILKRAMLAVQDFSDTALLNCSLRLVVMPVARGELIRLYQGGETVLRAVDPYNRPVEYTRRGNCIHVNQPADVVTVDYQNTVDPAAAEELMPVVWELATAIYDGEDTTAQAAILAKTYGWS